MQQCRLVLKEHTHKIIGVGVKFTISSLVYGHASEKTVVVPSVLQIEVETYQTPKQILSPVHILSQITAQNLIQSRTLVYKQFAERFV